MKNILVYILVSFINFSLNAQLKKPVIIVSTSYEESINQKDKIISVWIDCYNDFYIADKDDITKKLNFEVIGGSFRHKTIKNEIQVIPDSSTITIKVLEGTTALNHYTFKCKKIHQPQTDIFIDKRKITNSIRQREIDKIKFRFTLPFISKEELKQRPKYKLKELTISLSRNNRIISTSTSLVEIKRAARRGDIIILTSKTLLIKYPTGKLDEIESSVLKKIKII